MLTVNVLLSRPERDKGLRQVSHVRLTDRALEQAQAVAGDKDVGVGAASIVQQCIRAGLLDEIHIDLVPVLLGGGVSLFDHLGTGPIDLERTRVIEGAGVTHLTYRVIK
jgi:dihydrofolate reductase